MMVVEKSLWNIFMFLMSLIKIGRGILMHRDGTSTGMIGN